MLAFSHIEKCGGTTLIQVLRQTFLFDHCDVVPRDPRSMRFSPDDMRELLKLRPSTKSISGHSIRLACNLESAVPQIRYYTSLRDPLKRYVSDYFHFAERRRFRGDFAAWLARDDRRNFQTKAIAGCEDLEIAKSLLAERFDVVGVVEQFDELFRYVRWLAWSTMGVDLGDSYRVANSRRESHQARHDAPDPFIDFGNEIREANLLDLELYEFAKREVLTEQRRRLMKHVDKLPAPSRQRAPWWERMRQRQRSLTYRAYRNCVYKPYMGRWPIRFHMLPVYDDSRGAA
jgi:hypothetical protein